jgi:hypothetical protein
LQINNYKKIYKKVDEKALLEQKYNLKEVLKRMGLEDLQRAFLLNLADDISEQNDQFLFVFNNQIDYRMGFHNVI